MEPAVLGLVLDSSPVIAAELGHRIYRSKIVEVGQRQRQYIEELVSLVPIHPVTNRTAWLVGQIEGREAAKGNVLPFNYLMIAAAMDCVRFLMPNKWTTPG